MIANLSLRIGLGQVLTNNVLSLFVGDEIDASLDLDRAEYTANTLQALKNRISQILLITHKRPSADYISSWDVDRRGVSANSTQARSIDNDAESAIAEARRTAQGDGSTAAAAPLRGPTMPSSCGTPPTAK